MKYHNIIPVDMKNGTGLRVSLWVAGCSHGCKGCHNPITHDPDYGLVFDEDAKKELFSYLDKEYIEGLTLTGGDPLYEGNREAITELLREVHTKFPDKNVWVYTGYDFKDVMDLECMRYIDILVDGKFVCEKADIDLHWRGSSNQNLVRVKEVL